MAANGVQDEPRWTCFHCGETFTNRQCAADHFGASEAEEPACRIAGRESGILNAFRKAREELAGFYAEDTELHRYIHALEADHQAALRRAEEDGYNKGVREAQHKPAIRDAVAYARREGIEAAAREADAEAASLDQELAVQLITTARVIARRIRSLPPEAGNG